MANETRTRSEIPRTESPASEPQLDGGNPPGNLSAVGNSGTGESIDRRSRRPDGSQAAPLPVDRALATPPQEQAQTQAVSVVTLQQAVIDWTQQGRNRFTLEQEMILRQPVNPDLVEIKEDGTVYMPGAWFRKVLNDAFGPGGWQLVVLGGPKEDDGYYYIHACLIAEGKPVARTYGEFTPQFRNKRPTHGTIFESCVTDAITKCCKTLGVAEELWFPAWTRKWKHDNAHVVGKNALGYDVWKRKDELVGAYAMKPGYSGESEYQKAEDYYQAAQRHMDAIARGEA